MPVDIVAIPILKALLAFAYRTEVEGLQNMRDAAEAWYNELVQPLLPVLVGEIPSELPSQEQRTRLIALVEKIEEQAIISNHGDALSNQIPWLEATRGVPLLSSRPALIEALMIYLTRGDYVKGLSYGPLKSAAITLDSW